MGMNMALGTFRSLTTCFAIKIPIIHIAKEASNRMAETSTMNPGLSISSIGPGATPWSRIAPKSMAAGGLPGIPMESKGIMAPPIQALLATSEAMMPSSEPFPNFSGVLEDFFAEP